MRNGIWYAVAAALLVAGSACTASRVDPDAAIAIRGLLQRQNETPVAGARVALARQTDPADVFTTVFSLGLSCLSDELPNACRGARIATSSDDGSFAYRLRGRDTQGLVGTASTMELTARMRRAPNEVEGPVSSRAFLVQAGSIDAPLRFWEPRLAATADRRTTRVTWSRLPGSILPSSVPLSGIRADVVFEGPNGRPVWRYRNVRSGDALDARLLEDSAGSVSVLAHTEGIEVADHEGSRLDVGFRSGRRAYERASDAPASRGASCSIDGEDGAAVAQASCGLTDGDFEEAFRPVSAACDTPCAEPSPSRAVVDLGRTRPVDFVVLRGCNGRCTVETSRDARTWRLAGGGGDGFDEDVALRLAAAVRARYVRVRAAGGLTALREVSVWEARRPAASARRSILVAPGSEQAERPSVEGARAPAQGRDGGVRIDLNVRAILPALVALLLVGAFARRRRRRAR